MDSILSPTSTQEVVVDSSVLVAVCAREAGRFPIAGRALRESLERGDRLYAPGVAIAESLFALCRKAADGLLSPEHHLRAVRHLEMRMRTILPPPYGDGSLVLRAEQLRGSYRCSRSADAIYLALAEELSRGSGVEILTFDAGMIGHGVGLPGVVVRLLR